MQVSLSTTAAVTGIALAIAAPVAAQAVPEIIERVAQSADSGYLTNNTGQPVRVFRHVARAPGRAWLQLQFKHCNLPQGSFLRLTSVLDGAVETFEAHSLADYDELSSAFNGDSVTIELIAGANTSGNRAQLVELLAGVGPAPLPPTICGPADDRRPSNDVRQGRQHPTGCTSWLGTPTTAFTAGHCISSSQQNIHFNVPLSTSSGGKVLPPPKDQYRFDMSTLRRLGGGVGADWAVVSVFRNATTGLYPGQAQGAWYNVAQPPGNTSGQTIRITGYGTTGSTVPRQWNQAQKTHTGAMVATGNRLRYTADTTGGNSGSPVIHENTGNAVGIHTHGGCSRSGGSNTGTGFTRSDLRAAFATVRTRRTAGVFESYGSACRGTAGTPELANRGFPDIGKTMTLVAGNLPSNQPGAMLFGTSNTSWNGLRLPFDLGSLGAAGCRLYTGIDTSIPVSTGSGTASLPVAIPNNRSLIGGGFFTQYANVDRGANAGGLTTTNGGQVTIGD